MVFLFIILFCLLNLITSYTCRPIIHHIKKFDDKSLKSVNAIEPYYKSKKNTSCCLFFTGGNSFIIPEIYNNFFNKLASNQISVYTPEFGYKNMDRLIETLSTEYKEVVFIGHSSGSSSALNKHNELVKKIILLDPVNTNIFSNKKKFSLKKINSLMFINAAKSYKINYDPFGLPFIPFLTISHDLIENTNIYKKIYIEAEDFGHCDILNKPYSNLMHNSRISVGNKDRSKKSLDEYHIWMSDIISLFINGNLKDFNKVSKNINCKINKI